MKRYSKGAHVTWLWGKGTAEGTVDEVIEKDITRVIKGSEVSRHGSPKNPAYVIKQVDGTLVLKLHSELN